MQFYLLLSFFYTFNLFPSKQESNTFLLPTTELINQVAVTECRCADSLVLVIFYEAMNGDNWTESWELNQPLETWKGVALNNGDCVAGITLNANNLEGILPDEIGDLKGLKNLALGNNIISGTLPESLGDLRSLEGLNLRNNQITGILPTDLGKLSKLATLNLGANELVGNIPTQIGNMESLTGLFLNSNNFSGNIPIQLGNLKDLVSINLSDNQLTGVIPNEIGQLVKLVGIGLNDNQLSGQLPISFGQLEKLVSLRMENNQLTGAIPAEYGDLPRLETIVLSNNNLSGCFPENLQNLCPLMEVKAFFGRGYNFKENPLLPWEGDFSQFCAGKDQQNAVCNDGNPNTIEDGIDEACNCGKLVPIVEPEVVLEIALNTISSCPNENTGQVNLVIQPSTDTYLIDWIDPDGNQTQWNSNNVLELTELASGNHQLTITSEVIPTLTTTQSFEITTINCFEEAKIPQLITPNGDGLNERFIFEDLENNPTFFKDNEILIFNRWGDVVFQAKPYQNDWSGQNNTGQSLPGGTYYYVFKLDLNEGRVIKGDITIIR